MWLQAQVAAISLAKAGSREFRPTAKLYLKVLLGIFATYLNMSSNNS